MDRESLGGPSLQRWGTRIAGVDSSPPRLKPWATRAINRGAMEHWRFVATQLRGPSDPSRDRKEAVSCCCNRYSNVRSLTVAARSTHHSMRYRALALRRRLVARHLRRGVLRLCTTGPRSAAQLPAHHDPRTTRRAAPRASRLLQYDGVVFNDDGNRDILSTIMAFTALVLADVI